MQHSSRDNTTCQSSSQVTQPVPMLRLATLRARCRRNPPPLALLCMRVCSTNQNLCSNHSPLCRDHKLGTDIVVDSTVDIASCFPFKLCMCLPSNAGQLPASLSTLRSHCCCWPPACLVKQKQSCMHDGDHHRLWLSLVMMFPQVSLQQQLHLCRLRHQQFSAKPYTIRRATNKT